VQNFPIEVMLMLSTSKPLPLNDEQDDVEQTFHDLVERWREETAPLSSVMQIVMHPAYQRIIGLGRPAVSLILRELQERPDHWFWALHAITGEDPAQSKNNFDDAVEAWLTWGRERGYLT
jgi:hypothetical protein